MTYGCQKQINAPSGRSTDDASVLSKKYPQLLKDFTQVNLIGDDDEYSPLTIDPNLSNAWGLSFSPGGIAWISSFNPGLSLVYNTAGVQLRPPVAIPSPGGPTGGHPTGTVFNGSNDFVLSNGAPARFIFDGVDGIISGWNPTAGNFALTAVNNSATSVYTGLALAQDGGNNFLYAANLKTGKIDVFDKNFMPVDKPFTDPTLPAGYA